MTRLAFLCLLCLGLARPPRPHVPHAKAPAAKGAQLLMGGKAFFASVPPPRTNSVTIAWECPSSPTASHYVTGIAWAPSPLGPWTEATNLPYAASNRVTLRLTNNGAVFRAFNRVKA